MTRPSHQAIPTPRVLRRTYDPRSSTIDVRYIDVAMPRVSILEARP